MHNHTCYKFETDYIHNNLSISLDTKQYLQLKQDYKIT
jgi:hypothetical protein